MKSVDHMVLKLDRDKEAPDYQARYSGRDLTFAQLKVWTLKAESFEDVVKSAKLRKLFDL